MTTPAGGQTVVTIMGNEADEEIEEDLIDEPGPGHTWTAKDDREVAIYRHPYPNFGGVRV